MVRAGADVIVAHMGVTVGAASAKSRERCVEEIDPIAEAAICVRPENIVLCHGGPIAEPDDVKYVLDRTQAVAGFFGASSIERLPTEQAITSQVKEFKGIAREELNTRV